MGDTARGPQAAVRPLSVPAFETTPELLLEAFAAPPRPWNRPQNISRTGGGAAGVSEHPPRTEESATTRLMRATGAPKDLW